jgi:formylglycine-generating enzyme required for sulfatase activity
MLSAQTISISGTVIDTKGTAIAGAAVTLLNGGQADTTDEDGLFNITGAAQAINRTQNSIRLNGLSATIRNGMLALSAVKQSDISLTSFALNGKEISQEHIRLKSGEIRLIPVTGLSAGISIYRIRAGTGLLTFKNLAFNPAHSINSMNMSDNSASIKKQHKTTAEISGELSVTKKGYLDFSMPITSYDTSGIEIQLEKDTSSPYPGMVYIPAGSFMMGSPDDKGLAFEHPQHTVELDAFYMDTIPLTHKTYKELMGFNPSVWTGDEMLPIENVTWFDAIIYCNTRSEKDGLEPVYSYGTVSGTPGDSCFALENLTVDWTKTGYRLPTEAEWEYACRAGTTGDFYWGTDSIGDYAWWEGNSGLRTQPVGVKKPNAWGLHDMAGNIQEWCWDWFTEDYYSQSPAYSPKGPNDGIVKVLRGGSWYPYQDNAAHLRSANRSCNYTYYRRDAYGFRCVVPAK